ncbi:hypothetical protein As57867_018237, partial [Aphanomyces stellatus]
MCLARSELDDYKAQAKQAVAALVQNAFALQQHKLAATVTNRKTNRQALIYVGHDSVDPTVSMIGAHTFLRSSMAAVADFFHLDSQAKCDAYGATLGTRIVARKDLVTVEPREAMTATTISWFAYESPMLLLSRRDFCVME